MRGKRTGYTKSHKPKKSHPWGYGRRIGSTPSKSGISNADTVPGLLGVRFAQKVKPNYNHGQSY